MRAIPFLLLALILSACVTPNVPEATPPVQTAVADQMCGLPSDMAAALAEEYGERLAWMGTGPDGMSILWVGPDSWSWMTSRPDGTVCLDRVGGTWQVANPGTPA